MVGATGIACRARMKGCRGDMVSTADGMTGPTPPAEGVRVPG